MTENPVKPSYGTKTILVVLLLLTFYPVGLILMFLWMKWSKLVKFLITVPLILLISGVIVVFVLAAKQGKAGSLATGIFEVFKIYSMQSIKEDEAEKKFKSRAELLQKEANMFKFNNYLGKETSRDGCKTYRREINTSDGYESFIRCEKYLQIFYGIDRPLEKQISQIYDAFILNGWEFEVEYGYYANKAELMEYVLDNVGRYGDTGFSFKKGDLNGSVKLAKNNIEKLSSYSFCDIFCKTIQKNKDKYKYFFDLFFSTEYEEPF